MAVGQYAGSHPTWRNFFELWNGRRWTMGVLPNPPGGSGGFIGGVSCSKSTSCVAVGWYEGRTKLPFAEVWNGSRWVFSSAAVPQGKTTAYLLGVGCFAGGCVAVGMFDTNGSNDSVTGTLVEHWNGRGWTVEPTFNPSNGGRSPDPRVLLGVSCRSASMCTAAGSSFAYNSRRGWSVPLAERWNGQQWTIQSAPDPTLPG